MLNSFTLMRAFLPNNKVGVLPTKHIIDNFLLPYFHEVPLQFVHKGVEELVNISLNAGVNWLPIEYEGPAKTFCRINITVR